MERNCKVCKRQTGLGIKIGKIYLCNACFDFLLNKYKTTERIKKIMKQYGDD